jgi:arginine N-succinyltransferase
MGTASIVAAAGYSDPFYAFRNDALIHASRELQVNRKIHALTMSHELTGKSRLAGYYIDPSLRHDAAAQLMSRARMMYIAANRKRFTPEVFSLLLGVTDENGVSPFWEAVGRKFFGRDFADIEIESGGRSRTFIAEVMPTYPIYVPLLPEAAQRVLGEPDSKSWLAYEIHQEEGFETDRFIDIFDAGPVLTAQVDRSACVTRNETRQVRAADHAQAADAATYLIAHNGDDGEFRCVLGELAAGEGAAAALPPAARAVLGVQEGDAVRCVPLHRQDWEDTLGEAQ